FEKAERDKGQPIGRGTAVIAWTGQDRNWAKDGWTKERPFVPTDSAQWLVSRGVTLFATDLVGIDDPAEWWWPTHVTLLKGGVTMVQQLCNLDKLVGREFVFVALPLPMRGGTASPARPIALVL